ncbi:hypothetical protein OH76DRAFT_1479680 [Lentinus brumalis]|uniref:Uncharacterized protein n=1 Tax=Lentinus brumalis TaxID=2498619 RepID=A0A371DN30_9APHY|nr:hypothetical protein OH76DRAFT_1479680 [Polyporus brumalis]
MAVFVIGQNTGVLPTLVDDVPASEKAALREQWRRENTEHLRDVTQWAREREDHRQELRFWEVERETRVRDRERWKTEVEAERQDWLTKKTREREQWKRKVEAERRDWWAKENSDHEQWRKKVDTERQNWTHEGEEWARRREEEERHRKEVEHRRQGVWWSEPWKNKGCDASGIQAYSAYLFDLPEDLNWLDICMDMPIQIEGKWFDRPNKCERTKTHVWATWMVDEPQCRVYWDRFEYIGCSPGHSGIRRYKAHLLNLHPGDDWDKMCNTSPADIFGVHYDRPTICVNEKGGRMGIWDIPDPHCD